MIALSVLPDFRRVAVALACVGFLCVSLKGQEAEVPPDKKANENRLAKESSPYLLLHAHNPIDWYPWGPEAFEKAKREDKPIFLSVGYSSCYWCHVMEREAFSNPKVAEFMNRNFVCIKVDREERPDIDDIYMTALIVYQQASGSGGGGGWPMSMFLDTDGNPIAGATYLPAEDTADGRTGFLTAAGRIHQLWKERRESVTETASMIAREVRRLSTPEVTAESATINAEVLEKVQSAIERQYDSTWGGVDFNPRRPDGPRFPNAPRLLFLMQQAQVADDQEAMKMVDHSLLAMAKGGIRDHLGGGFHRYSTERTWTVPHFEKMLYDQGQLLEAYSRAALVKPDAMLTQVIEELVGFIRRDMTLKDGGFCSALDAETNAIEGQYYVWSIDELQSALSEREVKAVRLVYGIDEDQDFEHGRILYLPKIPSEHEWTEGPDDLTALLSSARSKLLQIRNARPRPLLDDKVLTEWNALMIQGLAISGRLPGRSDDVTLASNAADFLLKNLRDESGRLLRSWRNGVKGPRAYLDDYAALISALRTLHETTSDERWMLAAKELQEQQNKLFFEEAVGTFYFTASDQEKLFARTSSPFDSVSSSGNSMAIRNLVWLSASQPGYRDMAKKLLTRFSSTMNDSPSGCSGLAMALREYLQSEPAAGAAFRLNGSLYQTVSFAQDEPSADAVPDETTEVTSFKPIAPDPNAPASPFKRNYDEKPVKARIYPYFDKLPRGARCPVAIELTIANNWHINANPASPDFLIPTEVTISSPQKIKLKTVRYPKHELLSMEGQEEKSHVYSGKVIIYALLEIDEAEAAEKGELTVEIRFQACNEKTCEAPDQIRLSGKLPIADPNDDIKKVNESKFPQKKDEEKSSDDPFAEEEGEKSSETPSKKDDKTNE